MLLKRVVGLPLFVWVPLLVILGFVLMLSFGGDSVLSRGGDETKPVADAKPLPPEPPVPAAAAQGSAPSCGPGDTISWGDASRYLNRRVTMVGPVSQVTGDEHEVHLDLGYGPGEHVDVQLLQSALPPRSVTPQQTFANKLACVNGVVQRTNGSLRVVIDKSADVVVL